jgi:hypothetical protein
MVVSQGVKHTLILRGLSKIKRLPERGIKFTNDWLETNFSPIIELINVVMKNIR